MEAEVSTTELADLSESDLVEATGSRRPEVEDELTNRYHVKWTYHTDVKPSAFDSDKSLHNQARNEPIDQALVDIYTEAVKRGDKFPAVLAYRPLARARFVMIDGNHRLAAHTADDKPLDMYEIDRDTHPRTIALLTFAMNAHHGKPTSPEERVQHAIYLVDNGASAGAAAAAMNVGVGLIRKAITRGKADRRADAVGLRRNEWDALSVGVKTRLWNISTDEGFIAAARLAYASTLNITETFDLVSLLNDSKSGTRQEAIVAAHQQVYQQRIQADGSGILTTANKRHRTPKQWATLVIAQTLAMPENLAIVGAFAEPERREASQRAREAGTRLIELANLLVR
jgi:hypothetical protein